MTPRGSPQHTRPGLLPLLVLLMTLTLTSSLVRGSETGSGQPNILFIVVDDAGFADFETVDGSMSTGNVTALKQDGVFLNQSYVLPMCTPSRAAFMTGRYPHTFGLQDNTVNSNMVNWISENFTFLPRELQRLNYTTHMLGKWHLGFCHPGLTPIGRGFDSFYGFLLGSHESYYEHTKGGGALYDWWDDDRVDYSAKGIYQTELLNSRAVQIIQNHDGSGGARRAKPFFMYLSYGAPHGPFEVPDYYMTRYCDHITNVSRRVHCGMMAAVDVGVGAVVDALKEKGLYENSLVVFLSDNGGPINGGSVNYPLRAGKKNMYEGGIRSYTVLKLPEGESSSSSSSSSSMKGATWSGLVHAVDWFPTFVSVARGGRLDYTHGYDMSEAIKLNEPSPREDFIMVSDFPKFNHTVLRWKQWKLLTAVPGLDPTSRWTPGYKSGWYPPYQLLENGAPWEAFKKRYRPSQYLLYNIEEDPAERTDLSSQPEHRALIGDMMDTITRYLGYPGLWNGTFPLHPLPSHIPTTRNNTRDGELATCWCHPYGLPDCRKPGNDDPDTDVATASTTSSGATTAGSAVTTTTAVGEAGATGGEAETSSRGASVRGDDDRLLMMMMIIIIMLMTVVVV